MEKTILIIGNGISGITAARNIRKKCDSSIIVISEESEYFFSRTALMYIYMGHMRFQDTQPYENNFWEKNKIQLLYRRVTSVQPKENQVLLENGDFIKYDSLILATGSKSNVFPWPGTDLIGVQGLYSKQDLERLEERTPKIKQAVIIGGGLIGIELAEMLLTRNIEVHFLVRENQFWANVLPAEDASIVSNHLKKHHGLHMHYGVEVDTINGDDQGEVKSITTKTGEEIICQLVSLTVGVTPNIDFLIETEGLEIERGILVNDILQTSIPNIYAIGDCAQMRVPVGRRRNIEQVWYTGRMMGEAVADTICGISTPYNPGIWFNSAKFFDLEYQTYGWVFPNLGDNEEEFVWKDNKGERLLHFVFDKNTKEIIGINTFGIRLRHELLDSWLNDEKSIEFVLSNFTSANFDPEFFKTFEKGMIDQFNKKFNTNIQPSSKKWWQKLTKNV